MASKELPFDSGAKSSPKLTVQSEASVLLFATLISKGRPDVAPMPARTQGLSVAVEYSVGDEAVAPGELEEGNDVTVTVTVTNHLRRPVPEIPLSHLVPTGFEIRNERLDGRRLEGAPFSYQDIRDDRVFTYLDLAPGESRTITVRVHAQFPGRFFLPPIQAEAMYDPRIQGSTKSEWIEIRAPGPTS